MKNYLKSWPLVLLMLGLISCQTPEEEEQDVEEPTDSVVEDGGNSSLEDVGACYVDTYEPTPEDHVAELDILIVSYNSINLKPHRRRLVENMHHLFAQIPEEVNYRVGVMQGLGSHSSKSGKLYQRHSEPYVLKSDVMDVQEIKSHLDKKLNPPTVEVVLESIFGGGSMGLYSLYKGLTDHQDEIKTHGLLRENASLLVLYVSDQADVCARYPEGVDTFNRRLRSTSFAPRHKAFERDCLIENDSGENIQLDHEVVYDKIKDVVPHGLNISGVIYNNQATVPHAAWKEFGYGYNDIIEKAGGITHDLASSNYDEALMKIGMVSSASVISDDKFNLQVSDVLVSTIDVEIDGQAAEFEYVSELNQVHLQESRSSLSEVEVSYCERKKQEKENLLLTAGGNHNCVVHNDGGLRCWGMNTFGQLGLGHSNDIGDDEAISSSPPLYFEDDIKSLAAGGFHSCALTVPGDVYCWGRNDFGQLGLGDTLNRGIDELANELSPVDLGAKATDIYAGTFVSCAILEDDTARCWGDNRLGQLGLGHIDTVGDDEKPVDVPALSFDKDLSQFDLSTVSNHVCALFTDGSQKCWGNNFRGQLGLGDQENRADDEPLDSVPYISVDNEAKPIFVATGNEHTCVLLDSQNMKCWGRNFKNMFEQPFDQLGAQGDSPSDYEAINFGTSISSLSTGNYFNCAVSTSNQVKCWGDNRAGQVGYPTDDGQLGENTAIADLPYIDLGDHQVSSVVGGGFHTCVLTKNTGKVFCWGRNNHGQLGYGDTLDTSSAESPSVLERGPLDFESSEDSLP